MRTFVEPEVLPGLVGDEVAGPRVRDLMNDDIREGTVAGKESGCDKGEARVLHPTVREGRWHAQHVIPAPPTTINTTFITHRHKHTQTPARTRTRARKEDGQ